MLDKDFDNDITDDDVMDNESGDNESGAVRNPAGLVAPAFDAHASTPLELARMGLSEIAYIRQAVVNDVPMWTIHSAAGDPLGAAQSFDQAWAAVRQNDLEPVRVH